jgi:hypothetical protein
VTFICVLCTRRTQILRSICNLHTTGLLIVVSLLVGTFVLPNAEWAKREEMVDAAAAAAAGAR